MRFSKWVASAAVAAVIVLGNAGIAESQVVEFSEIKDAVPNRFFDPAATEPDPLNPNRLVFGLHSGMDWTTWRMKDFRASSAAYSHSTAMDTLSFTVTAPEGFFISRITYNQRGSGSVARIGFAGGAGNWTIDGVALNLGTFGTSPALSRSVDLAERKLTTVSLTVTMNLSAFATSSLGSATLTLTGADVLVEIEPLPLQ